MFAREAVDERDEPGLHVLHERRVRRALGHPEQEREPLLELLGVGGVGTTRSARSWSRRRVFSGGSSSSRPASSATIVAAGANVAVSVNGRARPVRTGTSSSRPATSSSARRDFPMPGSPRTLTSTGWPVLVARCRLSRRIASSLERPTNGIVRRALRGVRRSTGKPAIVSPSKPFAVA